MIGKPTLAELAETTLRFGLEISLARETPSPDSLRAELELRVARFADAAAEAEHGGRAVELAAAGLRAYAEGKARRRLGGEARRSAGRDADFRGMLEEAGRDGALQQARQVLLLCQALGLDDGSGREEEALLREADALRRERTALSASC